MFNILDRYIGRTVFSSISITLFILISLSAIIKFVEQIKKVGTGSYSIWDAGIFTLVTIPKDCEIFFPMAVLLGSLIGLGMLASRNELLIIQASGISKLRISMSVIKIIIPLIILIMIIGEWVIPNIEQWARNYRTKKILNKSLIISNHSLWTKNGNDFIYIQHIINNYKIKNIFIYKINKKKINFIIFAKLGIYNLNTHQWKLSNINIVYFKNKKNIIFLNHLFMDWKTNFNPEKLSILLLDPDSLSISTLYKYIKYLKKNEQDNSIYRLSMLKKISSPFSIIVMFLMSISSIFGLLRNVSIGIRIIFGIFCGFVFYLLNEGFGNLSLIYGISPYIVVLLPSILFLGLSLILLIRY